MSNLKPLISGYPRLVVKGVDDAIRFVEEAFGGTLAERFADVDGRVVHSKILLGDVAVSFVEEVPQWGWVSPLTLGGSPVLIQLDYENCDAVADRMIALGAEVVIAIENRAYGKREGRLRDPFGHLWILSQDIAK